MLFPFLVAGFKKLNTVATSIVGLACFGGFLFITYYIVPLVTVPASIPFVAVKPEALSIDVAYQYGFLRCFFGFVLGMVVYQFYSKQMFLKILGNGFVISLAVLALFICMHFGMPDVITVLFFPVILLSAAYGSTILNLILGSKPPTKTGRLVVFNLFGSSAINVYYSWDYGLYKYWKATNRWLAAST